MFWELGGDVRNSDSPDSLRSWPTSRSATNRESTTTQLLRSAEQSSGDHELLDLLGALEMSVILNRGPTSPACFAPNSLWCPPIRPP